MLLTRSEGKLAGENREKPLACRRFVPGAAPLASTGKVVSHGEVCALVNFISRSRVIITDNNYSHSDAEIVNLIFGVTELEAVSVCTRLCWWRGAASGRALLRGSESAVQAVHRVSMSVPGGMEFHGKV